MVRMAAENMEPIYLDYNATTPVAPEVRDAVCASLDAHWGNPSSDHAIGMAARQALEQARSEVASLLNARPEEIVFNSGGTEGNSSVLLGVAMTTASKGRHIVSSAIEHPSVMNPLLRLMEQGWDVTFLPVGSDCMVDPGDLRRALRRDTVMVSVMLANNETGAIQPVRELASIAREAGALVHTDASQAVGKVAVDVDELGVDYLTVAGHKLYGPKGIGAVYVRSGTPWECIMPGGGQERGRRHGTEAVSLAVGLAAACKLVSANLEKEGRRQRGLRNSLLDSLQNAGIEAEPNVSLGEGCLPNTLSLALTGCDAAELLRRVPRVLASLGSACHSPGVSGGERAVSHVLAAMGMERERALATVRFSVGRYTTADEVEEAAGLVAAAAKEWL